MATKVAELRQAMLRLKNANPEGFDQFVNVLNTLAMDMLVSLSEAPSDHILVMQGQSQQARWFLRQLRECHLEPKATVPTP